MGIFWFLLTVLFGYLAWRSICGGFERSQSQRLNGFGIFACVLFFIIAAIWVSKLFG